MEANATHFSLQSASRLAFRERYMQRFLPLLSCVREKSAMKRFKAVKSAADLSLACTVGKTRWSKALCRRLSVQTTQKQRNSVSSIANEAGLAFLKRLRRRRVWARAQPLPLNYRKSYLQAQREHRKSKLQAAQYCKLEETDQVASRPNMITQYGNLEASKLSSLSELIPGGLHMDIPKLLDQAAHYIISLQLQVDALSFLGQTLSTSKHL